MKLLSRARLRRQNVVIVAVLVGIVGTILLLRSFAANENNVSIEAEFGTREGDVTVAYDPNASGGQLNFYNPAPPTPLPPPPPPPGGFDPLAIACVVPDGTGDRAGGMAYTNWHMNEPGDLTSIKIEAMLDKGYNIIDNLYFQMFDGGYPGTSKGYYFGMQSHGLLIFSFFGNRNASNVWANDGSYAYANNNEGEYISLRRDLGVPLRAGTYTFRLTRASQDGEGDWFDFFVKLPNTNNEILVGALRFERLQAGVPMVIRAGGGTWTESYSWGNSDALAIPVWSARYRFLEAIGTDGNPKTLKHIVTNFGQVKAADIRVLNPSTLQVEQKGGGVTPRCHRAGTVQVGGAAT